MRWIEHLHNRHVHVRRVRILSARIADLLSHNATVLDVGCGDGRVASSILQQRPDITMHGVDILVRPHTAIPVTAFDGHHLPFPTKSFRSTLLIDVLHHTENPLHLLREVARVTQQQIIIKDHLQEGLLARTTLCFMDRIGNRRFGVPLPHTYWTRVQWLQACAALGTDVGQWTERLRLYPWPFSLFFDRHLHLLYSLTIHSHAPYRAPCTEHGAHEQPLPCYTAGEPPPGTGAPAVRTPLREE